MFGYSKWPVGKKTPICIIYCSYSSVCACVSPRNSMCSVAHKYAHNVENTQNMKHSCAVGADMNSCVKYKQKWLHRRVSSVDLYYL